MGGNVAVAWVGRFACDGEGLDDFHLAFLNQIASPNVPARNDEVQRSKDTAWLA